MFFKSKFHTKESIQIYLELNLSIQRKSFARNSNEKKSMLKQFSGSWEKVGGKYDLVGRLTAENL